MHKQDLTHTIRRSSRTAIYGALFAALSPTAVAGHLNYDLSLRYLHSDNIALLQDKVGESVISPRLRFDLAHDSSTLIAQLQGDVQYLDYRNDIFDDGIRGEFSGNVEWHVVPERITFIARDTLSEQSVSSLAAFTPGNQQKINILEAGPTFMARFNEVTSGQLDLRYTSNWAEETESFNSDRYNMAARLLRQISNTKSLTFNLEASRTAFDLISSIYDYNRYDAYVTYQSQLARLAMTVDLGHTRLEPEDGDKASGALLRGHLAWQATPRSTVSTQFGYEYSDASQDLIRRVGTPDQPANPNEPNDPIIGQPGDPGLQIIPDAFRQKRVDLSYEFTGERLSFLVQPRYERLRYLRDSTFDTNSHGISITGSYEIRPQVQLSLVAQRYKREFVTNDRDDTDLILGAGIATRFSRHWGAQFDYRHRKRDSSIDSQIYTENMVAVAITYYR